MAHDRLGLVGERGWRTTQADWPRFAWKASKATWDEERKELIDKLKQAEGQAQQLQGEVKTRDDELIELHVELYQTQEAQGKADFMLGYLEVERDSMVSQLVEAREGCESEITHLN